MKVASILEEARWGGPQSRLVQTAKALKDSGVDHIAVIPREDNERLHLGLVEKGCPVREVKMTRMENRALAMISYLLLLPLDVFRIARVFMRDRVNVVHVQGGAWQFKGAIAAKLTGAKVVWHLNDTSSPWFIRRFFKLVGFFFADEFIVQGQAVKDYYLTGLLQNKKVAEMFGIVDEKFLSPGIEKKAEQFVVVTVGTVTPTKDYFKLLDIACEVQSRGLNVEFVVAGRVNKNHQDYFTQIEQRVLSQQINNVKFLGECFDVEKLLENCSVYLCCSRAESSPTSVWEGMARGLPAITTNVGNVSQVIRDGRDGFICGPDVSDLADKIEKFYNNPSLLKSMGEDAHQRIEELFGYKQNGEALKSIYQGLLSN